MHIVVEQDPQTERKAQWDFRTWSAIVFGVFLVAFILASRVSEMNSHVRLLLAITLVSGLFSGAMFLARFFMSRPRTLYPVSVFLVFFIVWTVLGSRPPDVEELRGSYVKRLGSFEGVRFVWGGESHNGVDCSGLARVALWQAMLREGVKEFNPRLLGPALWSFWWNDVGAVDIDRAKYGYTRVIGYAPKLAGYDTSDLVEGDMAVASASHVLIYYGGGLWIEASPHDGKVVINPALANSTRGYFNTPVTLVRWRMLEPGESGD